jgi:hypothetical protein
MIRNAPAPGGMLMIFLLEKQSGFKKPFLKVLIAFSSSVFRPYRGDRSK